MKRVILANNYPIYYEEKGENKFVLYHDGSQGIKKKEEVEKYFWKITNETYFNFSHESLLKNLPYSKLPINFQSQRALLEYIEWTKIIDEAEELIWKTGGVHGRFTYYNKYMTCYICQEKITEEQFKSIPYWHTITHQTHCLKKGSKWNCLLPRKASKDNDDKKK